MLDEPITTYDGTGVHEHTLDELRGINMNAFKACIHINNKYIDDFMLIPITVYPASESTVRYVDRNLPAHAPAFKRGVKRQDNK